MSKRPWNIVFAATVANIPCVSGILVFTQSLFMGPLIEEFGWSQTAILAPVSVALLASAVLLPTLGFVVDRYGVRVVMLPLLVLFGATTTSLALLTGSYGQYFLLMAVAGVATIGQSPLLYGRIVAGWVTEQRGLAIAVALSGVAIGNLLWPPIASLLIEEFGWRWARAILGLSILVVTLPTVWLLLPEPPPATDRPISRADTPSVTTREILLSRHFWQIATAVLLIAMAVGGHASTLALLFKPNGIPMSGAALALSALALAQIVGRLLSGRLLDAVPTAAIGALWSLFGAAGIAVVSVADTLSLAILGGALLGLAVGSEIEIAAYFSLRFFGLAAFGRVYGLLLAVFVGGNALGPLVLGLGHDTFGTYAMASTTLFGALLAAAALIMTLGPYRFAARGETAQMEAAPQT